MIKREKAQRSIHQAKKDFGEFTAKPSFTAEDEGHLVYHITDLLGWYNLHQDPELARLIETMIFFGEKKQWSMAGSRIMFERIKQKKSKPLKT